MPETTILQIRSRGPMPARVLELTGLAARVGCGAQCEVRLDDPALAEVQCVLRRRGRDWHVQSLGPRGGVTLDGEPVERQRPLPLGATLSVGEHALTLQAAGAEAEGVGSFDEPIGVETREVEVGPAPAALDSADAQGRLAEADQDRLARWQASLERRERWLKSRQEELRWEKRWKAAGERLRARSAAPSAPASPAGDRAAAPPGPGPSARRTPQPAPRPPAPPAPPSEVPPEDRGDASPRLGAVTRLEPAGRPVAPTPPPAGLLDPDEIAARLAWEQSGADEPPIEVGQHAGATTAPVDPGIGDRFGPEWSRIWPEAPRGLPSPPEHPTADPAPIDRIAEEPGWPSAKEILAAARAERHAPAPQRHRSRRRPEPTVARAPDQWTLPAWMAAPPAFAVVLTASIGGLALAWSWSQDDRAAGALADHLLAGRPIPSAGLTVEPLPSPTWWGTTADHLLWRAAALGRVEGDPARSEEARFLLGQAAQASPAHPGVRFALARSEPDVAAGGDSAPSRDVVCLALAARGRLRAGRTEEALGLYRDALAMAAESDPLRAEPPAFDPDSRVQRYRLPNEDLFATILRDMAAEPGWTPVEWTSALPDRGVVWLTAYRVLKDQGTSGADEVLERLLGRPAPDPDDATAHAAIELASQAEALAFRGEWAGAEARYLEAIGRVADKGLRRLWWLNMAEIYTRLGDMDKSQNALENAWGSGEAEKVEAPGRVATGDSSEPEPDPTH